MVVGIDANAVVGGRVEGDSDQVVGDYGFGLRNARGDWLVTWCLVHELGIANTCYKKDVED
eukprot:10430224-Karenia_brevis.AAC.1